jgi:hypothetical protein
MPGQQRFSIKLNARLVASARHLHKVSQIGDDRLGPNKSIEAYLSDLVTVAIVERMRPGRAEGPNRDRQLTA